jgi:hypothetical protein
MGEIDTVIRQKALSGEIALPLDLAVEESNGSSSEEEV